MNQCDKPHITECPDYNPIEKTCPRGNKCPLVHRNKKKSKKIKSQLSQISKSESQSLKDENNVELTNSLDFKASYISFQTKNDDFVEKKIEENKGNFRI